MDYAQLKRELENQKEELSIDERAAAYACGEEVDILPYLIFSPDFAFAKLFGFTTKQLVSDIEVKCEMIRRRRDEFGLNCYDLGLSLRHLGYAFGSKGYQPEDGFDYITEFALDDYAKLNNADVINPRTNPILEPLLEEAKIIREKFPDLELTTCVVGPFSTAISIRNVERVMKDIIKAPDELRRLLDYCVECNLEWIRAFFEAVGPVGVGFADPATASDILSKKQFDEFSLPYLKKLMTGGKEITGYNLGAHICGHTKAIWNDLADLGLSNLSLDNCEDLEDAKNCVGDRMSISGNIAPVDVMLHGTIDDVISSAHECILKCGDNPSGYTLSMGCQLPIGTPRENIEAFIYAARKYGRCAQKGRMPKGAFLE